MISINLVDVSRLGDEMNNARNLIVSLFAPYPRLSPSLRARDAFGGEAIEVRSGVTDPLSHGNHIDFDQRVLDQETGRTDCRSRRRHAEVLFPHLIESREMI
jgi:hypothetical protein